MSSLASPNRRHFSREGFQPLAQNQGGNGNMATPNDATIDIPLDEMHRSNTTARDQDGGVLKQTPTTETSKAARRVMFRGRRQKHDESGQGTGHVGYDGEEDTINAVGRFYRKVLNFSIITRYFTYVTPLALLIAIPIVVGATAAQDAKIGGVRIVWFFTWVEVAWCSLWVSKIVAHFLPWIFQLIIGVVNSGIRKYALVLRSLEIPLSLVGWAVTSLATFIPIMTHNPTQRSLAPTKNDPNPTSAKEWENIVQQILGAATVASLIYLAEKFFIQLISINYHRKQFNARIRESKRNVYLLGLLYEASRNLFPAYCNEFAEEDYMIADQLNLSRGLGGKNKKDHRRSGSHTPMRLIQNIGRYGDQLTSVFGNVASEITGREVFNPNSAHSIVIEALEKKRTSEALARRIWMSFVMEGRDNLLPEDLHDVMGAQRRDEADEAFAALDKDANGDISLDEMILAVTDMCRERKAIATSMHDVDQAINVLDRLLLAAVTIAVIFVFIAFLNKSFVTTLATAGTALLSLSFVFSATAQEVLGSCIFLFVKHPYDIGDRVDIGADEYVVEHISLLFTVFRRVKGLAVGRLVQIPNISLNSMVIENVNRSGAMTEQLTVSVSFDTTFDDVQILKNELLNFVTDKDNTRDFVPEINIEVLGTTDMSKLDLKVELKHKSNWSNEVIRAARRSKFMCALVAALRAVPIHGPGGGGDAAGSAANPNYSVSITDSLAKENAQASADSKDKARLVPVKKIEDAKKNLSPVTSRGVGATGLSAHDTKIVDNLTSRNDPASDPTRDEVWSSSRGDDETLGRPSIDRQDLDEVRGLLRRESTRGKRKPSMEPRSAHAPSIPTINEPSGVDFTDYAQSRFGSTSAPYHQTTEYQSPSLTNYQPPTFQAGQSGANAGAAESQAIEMGQVGRSPSNPYRRSAQSQQSQLQARSPAVQEGEEEDDFDTRPYSGV